MKCFRKRYGIFGLGTLVGLLVFSCTTTKGISDGFPVSQFYEYDRAIPLKDSVNLKQDDKAFSLYGVTYNSVHDQRVTALLSIPKNVTTPLPVVILMHGKGDHKAVDYVEYGNAFFNTKGYAVLRLDFSKHGDRKADEYEFNLTGRYKYWTRNIISQTVFDLRRAVDFIETRKELNADRIGYFGISLGGMTGTIFCGVEPRVKVPIMALAGGQMNLLYERETQGDETKHFMSIVEPMNFVKQISPRPLLMLNAKNDEVVLPMMSKLLYEAAENPKEIIWYDAKHRDGPLDVIYGDALNWFKKYL